MAQVRADLELIRFVMGRQAVAEAQWEVLEAQPRHVFYQAQTLHRKTNDLAQELGGASHHAAPAAPAREIEPADVLGVVQAAHEHVLLVKAVLAIETDAELPPVDPQHEPKDVLRSIIQAGRQLNRLVDRRIKPEDVYRRLELAVGYTAGIAAAQGDPQPMALPAFEAGKMPRHVYDEVLGCMKTAAAIGERNGIAVLRLNLTPGRSSQEVAPADVYDVVTTLLSDLTYLSWRLDVEPLVPAVKPPTHIFPSHVYQIARLLREQLEWVVGP